jgi:quercetin dioxygenase-like cupin family protein
MEYNSIIKPPKSQRIKAGKVKLLPGEEIGEHSTDSKEELIVVLAGSATIIANGEETIVPEKEHHFIPEGTVHNVRNDREQTLEYIYIVSLLD